MKVFSMIPFTINDKIDYINLLLDNSENFKVLGISSYMGSNCYVFKDNFDETIYFKILSETIVVGEVRFVRYGSPYLLTLLDQNIANTNKYKIRPSLSEIFNRVNISLKEKR